MWTCPKCSRQFQKTNQSHICIKKDVGELFIDKSDDLVLAYDSIYQVVMQWQPNVASASTKSVVFTSKRAWMIIKPMRKVLDVKFYCAEVIESDLIHRRVEYGHKFAYHLRVSHELEVSSELLALLRYGYDYSVR
ncbi:MAG: DUF5655 domain-containing protein [Bacteroidota bacterium]